jgi:Flp pilus assembly protein TadD
MFRHLQMAKTLFLPAFLLAGFSYTFAQTVHDKDRILSSNRRDSTKTPLREPRMNEPPKLPFERSVIIYYKGPRTSSKSDARAVRDQPSGGETGDPKKSAGNFAAVRSPKAARTGILLQLEPRLIYYRVPGPSPSVMKTSETHLEKKTPAAVSSAKAESGPALNALSDPARKKQLQYSVQSNRFSGEAADFTASKLSVGLKVESIGPKPIEVRPAATKKSLPSLVTARPSELSMNLVPRPVPGSPVQPNLVDSKQDEARPVDLASPAEKTFADPVSHVGAAAYATAEVAEMNNSAVGLTIEANYSEAEALLRKAIEAEPGMAKLHRNLSIVYERMSKIDEAVVSAREAAKLAPDEPSVLEQLCALELATDNSENAIRCFEKLGSLRPLDVLSQTHYGTALFRSGKVDESLPVLEKAAASTPVLAEAQNAVGVVYYMQKRVDEAIEAFKRGVEAAPHLFKIRFNLGVAQLSIQNRAGAISQYNILKAENPELAGQLYRMLYGGQILFVDDMKSRKR